MKMIIGACLTLALAGPCRAGESDVESQIRSIIHERGLDGPGCAVGVLRDGKPFLTVAEGAADIEVGRPIDADTQFYSASIAKQFTALAVAQLVVAGKLGLNDDIRKYLPEMPRYQAPVSVYMLLHHTGGLRDMLNLGAYAGYQMSSDVTRAEALRLVYAQTDTIFPPGTQHRYSNSGYLLLSEIVARASGMPFDDYMKTRVFAPLGMTRSSVLTGSRTIDGNAAHGYAATGKGFRVADTHPYYGGAGGVVLTLRDLAKYDRDIQVTKKVWTPEVAKIMLEPGKLADGAPAASRGVVYAAGLGLNGPWVQHGGAGEGFKHMVAWLPDGRLSIHLLCNNGAVDPAKAAERIIDTFGTYPSLRPAIPSISGKYASADLPVTYALTPIGEKKIVVEIKPDAQGLGQAQTVELAKGEDGAFVAQGFRITLDDDRAGFMLGDIRSRVGLIHFKREP